MRQLQAQCDQPEEQRRFIRVRLSTHARQQPIAGRDHVARDQGETRLIRGPRVA
jgi:hypothetical protein